MRVLVVWEDEKHEVLGQLLSRRLSALRPPEATSFPQLLFHTVYGAGGFSPYVRRTWPRARVAGLPTKPGPIDHLICVGDGDCLHEQTKVVPSPPSARDQVPAWHTRATEAWQAELRTDCGAAPPETVHASILRWCKESLVLAGYDHPAFSTILGVDHASATAREHLERCDPHPTALEDVRFSDAYPRPLRCIQDLSIAASRGAINKKDPRLDDVIRELARAAHDLVAARVPDVDALARRAWLLT